MNSPALATDTTDTAIHDESADDPLVTRAAAGDRLAFEELYHRHVGRVYALCRRLAASTATAEECTQEAFIQAWEALPGFRSESAFGSWLHRIAVNAVLARQRKALRRSAWVRETSEDVVDNIASADALPGATIDLDRAITELPNGAREVFVLYAIEGYKHDEIATLTGLAVGTSKAHLHWARRLLQAKLK